MGNMLRQLNLIPFLVIPIATITFALSHDIVNIKWLEFGEREVPPAIVETFEIASAHTKKSYVVHVHLPGNYNETDAAYPVIYSVGSTPFPSQYEAILPPLQQRSQLPDIIVVAVEPLRKRQSPQMNFIQSRGTGDATRWADDLTLSVQEYANAPKTGGYAADFIAFFEKELFLKIESQYRVAPGDRCLAGHAVGGVFAIETALTRPELFSKYLALGPVAQWGNFSPVRLANEKIRMGFDPDVRLFVATGALETKAYLAGFDGLRKAFDSGSRKKFQVRMELMSGRVNDSIVVPGTQQGLLYLYRN